MSGARSLHDLATPAALVDVPRLEHNCDAMARRMSALGVDLRPHVKTHKCIEIARRQVEGHFGGITVSTLAEARHFLAAGFSDVTWAVPVAPARLAEAAEIGDGTGALHLLMDHADTLDAAVDVARRRGRSLSVWLEIDCGYGRTGVEPQTAAAASLARRMADSPHIVFRGLLTHAGQAYTCRERADVVGVAARERDVLAELARRLRADGIDVPGVSVGSTPTMLAVDGLDGVTEARPGNYAFFDAFQAAIGSCRLDDVAFSVLATVIGRYPERGTAVLDAGALALSRDPGPVHVDPACGAGVLATVDGTTLERLRLVSLSQEHGVVEAEGGLVAGELSVGSRVRVLPNHSCLAAALFADYHAVDGERVVDLWHPVRGW